VGALKGTGWFLVLLGLALAVMGIVSHKTLTTGGTITLAAVGAFSALMGLGFIGASAAAWASNNVTTKERETQRKWTSPDAAPNRTMRKSASQR